jgi:hypothetical protein
MANSIYLFPLRDPGAEPTLLVWLSGRASRHGVPEALPEPHPLPTVVAVLEALRAANCRGVPWFQVVGLADDALLPGSDQPGCPAVDLGEVTLQSEGRELSEPLRPDSPVDFVSCRRGSVPNVLVAACALASIGGPWVVHDPTSDGVCVTWPGDRPETLAERWSWS